MKRHLAVVVAVAVVAAAFAVSSGARPTPLRHAPESTGPGAALAAALHGQVRGDLDMESAVPDIPTGVTRPRYSVPRRVDSGGPGVVYRGGRLLPNKRGPVSQMFRTGFQAGEPSLGVDSKGRIFYQTIGPEVIRSTDGGKKWTDVSPKVGDRHRHPETLDPYLWLDPATDRVFTFDFFFGCSELSWTDDGGESWSTSILQCGEQDHQTLFGGPPALSPTVGYENVLYACSTQAGATIYSVAAQCSKSLDGGLTWAFTGSPAFVTENDPENDMGVAGYCHGAIGHGYVGPDGTVYIPKGLCGQPWLAISHDEGATWTRVQISNKGMALSPTGVYEHEAAVAADEDGGVYYFWIARDRQPYLATSKDGGEHWSKPIRVGPPNLREAALPTMDIGAKGAVAMTYMGSTNSPGAPFPESDDCKPDPASCLTALFFLNPPDPDSYEGVTWNGYTTVTKNALDARPTFASATVNNPNDPLVRGTCGPIRCKSVYDFLDVVVDKAGTVWSAFVDICLNQRATGGAPNAGNEGVVQRLDGVKLR